MPAFSKTARIAVCYAFLVGVILLLGTPGEFSAAQARSAYNPADYAGIWHLMFQGKPFATMTIELHDFHFTGSLTHANMQMGADGKLTVAEAGEGLSPFQRATLQDGVLHIVSGEGGDELEVAMTLTSAKTAELRFVGEGAPANAEVIKLEKVWSEPPVQP
jgi:hypothetical protein